LDNDNVGSAPPENLTHSLDGPKAGMASVRE